MGAAEEDACVIRPRRCMRLQKEGPVLISESDSCVADRKTGSKSKRRSSIRANVKKNCSCCTGDSESRKRTKSETADDTPALDVAHAAKKSSISNCNSSETPTSALVSLSCPSTTPPTPVDAGANKLKSKKNAQRKR